MEKPSRYLAKTSEGRAKQLANLVPPFKKGEVRNPKGRTKGTRSFSDILRDLLERNMTVKDAIDKTDRKVSVKEALMLKLIEVGVNKGKIQHIETIIERLEGKVVNKTEVTTVSADEVLKEKAKTMSDSDCEQMLQLLKKYETNTDVSE